MTCSRCRDRGWIDGYFAAGMTYTPSVLQCPDRCNVSGYSAEVQKRLNDPARVTAHEVLPIPPSGRPAGDVLPFRRRT